MIKSKKDIIRGYYSLASLTETQLNMATECADRAIWGWLSRGEIDRRYADFLRGVSHAEREQIKLKLRSRNRVY